jgi:hypothetical protein
VSWLEGVTEPTSSELGQLLPVLDPEFLTEIYAAEIAAMADAFEERIVRQKEAEARARAALEWLRPTRT